MHQIKVVSSLFYLYLFSSCTSYGENIISSPRVTEWGSWGNWSNCSNREYVYGFQLKIEGNLGRTGDDTGLNGIRLFCARIGQNRNFSHMLESASGSHGNWGMRFACPGTNFATAFELLSEPSQGGRPAVLGGDDTAANNLQLVCSRGSGETTLTGDGTRWGFWTGRQACPVGSSICGIRTQVEAPQYEGVDDSGLNNVDMKCCPKTGKA